MTRVLVKKLSQNLLQKLNLGHVGYYTGLTGYTL